MNELCAICSKELDPQKNEILVHVEVTVLQACAPVRPIEVTNKSFLVCGDCGLAGKVPYTDAALLKEILRAS